MNDNGWIKWQGGECPVAPDTEVDVKFKDDRLGTICGKLAGGFRWSNEGLIADIVAYRVIEDAPALPEPSPDASATSDQIGGDHYAKHGDMQPIHILRRYLTPEEFRGYTKGAAIAYLLREHDKGGDQDIAKARHHIQLWEELKQC